MAENTVSLNIEKLWEKEAELRDEWVKGGMYGCALVEYAMHKLINTETELAQAQEALGVVGSNQAAIIERQLAALERIQALCIAHSPIGKTVSGNNVLLHIISEINAVIPVENESEK